MVHMGVYITGDCHGNWWRLNERNIGRGEKLTKDDYVIVCGDFGIWHDNNGVESANLDELDKQPFTTLFVDGNHENFDRLYGGEFETVDFCGGKAHKIRNSIYHLIRGNVFELCGKKFFAFGGASSHDIKDGILDPDSFDSLQDFIREVNRWDFLGKQFRIKKFSWWEKELPTEEEMDFGRVNLEKYGNEVDFIISHCCPSQIQSVFSNGTYKPDVLTEYFDEIMENNRFQRWYFGHYHYEDTIMGKFIMKFEGIERVV